LQFDKLTTEELLALALQEKVKGEVVKELVLRYDTPRDFYQASLQELQQIKGIGPVKAARLKAVLELGYRLLMDYPLQKPVMIHSLSDALHYLVPRMELMDREHIVAFYLNAKNRLLAMETVFIGTVDSSIFHPRELFKGAVKHSASKIIVAHNHPSGDPRPSSEDLEVTRRLVAVGDLMGINVVDHLIIGEGLFLA